MSDELRDQIEEALSRGGWWERADSVLPIVEAEVERRTALLYGGSPPPVDVGAALTRAVGRVEAAEARVADLEAALADPLPFGQSMRWDRMVVIVADADAVSAWYARRAAALAGPGDELRTTPVCPHGDPGCPCPDGDACHYEDAQLPDGTTSPGMRCPRTGLAPCTRCRAGVTP